MNRIKTVVAMMVFALSVLGQTADELGVLRGIVSQLRGGGQPAYNAAVGKLATDALWTPMNELRAADASAECRASDRVPGFKLNKALAAAEQAQRFEATTGNMLNGEDARYNYSLYERAVKAGKTAVYTLNKRSGAQTFVFIPYAKDAKMEITASSGGKEFVRTVGKDGSVMLTGKATSGQPIIIYITNADNVNRSFALINHNSRR